MRVYEISSKRSGLTNITFQLLRMAVAPVTVASDTQDKGVSDPKIEHAVLLTAAPLARRILRIVVTNAFRAAC